MRHEEKSNGPGSTKSERWLLAILLLIYIFNVMDRSIIPVLAEPIRKELGLNDTQIGLITGPFFAVFYGAFGVPLAWLADRWGRIKVVAAACAVWSVFSSTGALASTYLQLVATRMGVAVAEAGGTAPSHSLIADRFPRERRGVALGIFSLGAPIGSFLAVLMAGWIGQHYGWRWAVLAVSLPGLLFALILYFTVEEPQRNLSLGQSETFNKGVTEFWRSPVLRHIVVGGAFGTASMTSMISWLPAYLLRVKGMSLGDLGIYYGLTSALALGGGMYFSGILSDRLSKNNPRFYGILPAICSLVGAPLLLAALFAGTWQLSLICFVMPLVLVTAYYTPSLVLVQIEAEPHQRGIFASLFLLSTGLIGAAIGPLLVGTVSDIARPHFGGESLSVGLASLAVVMLATSAIYFRLSVVLNNRKNFNY